MPIRLATWCGMSDDVKDRIRRLARERGLSLRALSLAAGLNETAVRDILRADTLPTLRTLMQLAAALEVDVATLVSDNVDLQADEAELMSVYRGLTPEQRQLLRAMGLQMIAAAHNLKNGDDPGR
jgi:transcriptional regulator with XRE-family HTH domain